MPDSERLRQRLTRLARVTGELVHAPTLAAVTDFVVVQCAETVDADISCLFLRDGESHLRMVALRGGTQGDAQQWERFPIDEQTPLGTSMLTGGPLVLHGAEEIARRYPALRHRGERTLVTLPLRSGESSLGVIGLTFERTEPVDAAELDFLEIVADSCAQALQRIAAREQADRVSSRMAFLAAAAGELSSSLDYEGTLATVARLVVPRFADWCAVDLLRDERLHRLAVAHVDPAKVQWAQMLHERYPSQPDAPRGPWQVIRSGSSELIGEITDEMLVATAIDDEHLRIARELDLRSAMIVPLIAHGRVLGVITLVNAESGQHYGREDLQFADDLAGRAAVAIDNAELHSQTLEAAVRLQQAVLPDALPEVAGWDLAKRYDASGRTDVGGDFYDVIPLRDGRLVLFVGDVMGRGVEAAAAMAQMRAAVRAFSALDPSPSSVMSSLDTMFARDDADQLVTLLYVVADPARDQLVLSNAGHPAPMVLAPDGTVRQLPEANGCPLGATAGERSEQTVRMSAGETLVAFTDGLIERREIDIDEGRAKLADLVPMLGQPDLQAALHDLVKALRDPHHEDDVAVLAARRSTDVAS